MRVLVLGGGVVGVTTAYQLQRDGHEVVLVERLADVARDTSAGNAGMIAPGHSFVWSSPKAPWILLKSLVLRDQALRFKPSVDPRLWSWSLKFLMQCTAAKARANTLRKHQIAVYSQSVLHQTLADVPIEYDRNTRGILYFYRDAASLQAGIAHMQILAQDGQRIEVLDCAQIVAQDRSLEQAAAKIAGGILCPTDETGDCAMFTRGLAEICRARGATLRTGVTVQAIETAGDTVAGVRTDQGVLTADAYVLALGCQSPFLTRPLGIDLPIYPIKGYSLTIPIGNHRAPPAMAVIDERNLVAVSRFGDRIRVTATAEFAGYDTSHRPADFAHMTGVAKELYPDGADYARAEMWAGLRPMTPDNLPIIGRKRHRNLWYNTGHGHIGWTMSHGSARLVADLIGDRPTAIPVEGLA
jgi:D-amino-acid dehydrogenase